MPDCAQCGSAIGHARGRCKSCGRCEDCCDCAEPSLFSPAELGLDPEDDVRYWTAQRARLERRGY